MGSIYSDSLSSPQLEGGNQSVIWIRPLGTIQFAHLIISSVFWVFFYHGLGNLYYFLLLYCSWRFTFLLNVVICHRYILGSYPLKSKKKSQQIPHHKHCSVPPRVKQPLRASYCMGRTLWCADPICPRSVRAALGQQRAELWLRSTGTLSTFIGLDQKNIPNFRIDI